MIAGIVAGGRPISPTAPPAVKEFIGATVFSPASATSVTLAMPAGVQVGDLLCFVIGRQPNPQTITAPAGWTVVIDFDAGGGPDRRYYIATKVAGASEPSATFTFSGSGNTAASLLAYRGVSAVTIGTPYSASYAATAVAPAVAMPTDGILLAIFYGNGAGSPITISVEPAGMTKRSNPSQYAFAQMPVYDQPVSSGSSGTRQITWSRGSSPAMAVLAGLT